MCTRKCARRVRSTPVHPHAYQRYILVLLHAIPSLPRSLFPSIFFPSSRQRASQGSLFFLLSFITFHPLGANCQIEPSPLSFILLSVLTVLSVISNVDTYRRACPLRKAILFKPTQKKQQKNIGFVNTITFPHSSTTVSIPPSSWLPLPFALFPGLLEVACTLHFFFLFRELPIEICGEQISGFFCARYLTCGVSDSLCGEEEKGFFIAGEQQRAEDLNLVPAFRSRLGLGNLLYRKRTGMKV